MSYKHFTKVEQSDIVFLKEMGLKPHHKILDIGCGGGRLGYELINYLEDGNYYGFDKEKGWIEKFKMAVLSNNLSVKNPTIELGDFTTNFGDVEFDYVYGYSVFTHINSTLIKQFFKNFDLNIKNSKIFVTGYFSLPVDKTENIGAKHQRKNEFVVVYYNIDFFDKLLNEMGYEVVSSNIKEIYKTTMNKIGPGALPRRPGLDCGAQLDGTLKNQQMILIEAKK